MFLRDAPPRRRRLPPLGGARRPEGRRVAGEDRVVGDEHGGFAAADRVLRERRERPTAAGAERREREAVLALLQDADGGDDLARGEPALAEVELARRRARAEEPGREKDGSTALQRGCKQRFETVPRDDHSSIDQPKRAENGRERSL